MSVRTPLVTVEVLSDGAGTVRAPLVAAEALITGLPKVRSSLLTAEALVTGLPKVLSPLVAIEVLSLVPPEPALVSTTIFPKLTEGWSVIRKPSLSSRISTHQAGREIRAQQMQYPVRQFTLTYEVLRSAAAYAELQAIEGFFLQQGGSFGQFLFKDRYTPDFQVTGGLIGTGDGTTTNFKLARPWGGFLEPVGYVFPADLTAVYLGGGAAINASTYSVTAPNNLVFTTAPAAGVAITADFAFYFQVRFGDDSLELEEFMSMLFELKECRLMQVLPS
jgi:uncharacterized protein (TIGR02217 family)